MRRTRIHARAALAAACCVVVSCGADATADRPCATAAACAVGTACVLGRCAATDDTLGGRSITVDAADWASIATQGGGEAADADDALSVGAGHVTYLRFDWGRGGWSGALLAAYLELTPAERVAAPGDLFVFGIDRPWEGRAITPRTLPSAAGPPLARGPIATGSRRARIDLRDGVEPVLRGAAAASGIVLARAQGGDPWRFVSPASPDVASRPRLVLIVR